MLGSARRSYYERALPHVLADPGVDAVVVIFVPAAVCGVEDVSAAVARASETAPRSPSRCSSCSMAARAAPMPGSFRYPGVRRASARPRRRARRLAAPAASAPSSSLTGIDRRAAREVVARRSPRADDVWLEPEETRRLLAPTGSR